LFLIALSFSIFIICARIFPASVLTAVADGAAVISERVSALISRRMTERRQAN